MCFGPAPHHMANIRKTKAAMREKQKKSTPCSGDIPLEMISVEQVPSVQTPSIFDDAVESAKAIESKLLVNVDGLLAKAEGIQKSIQGAFADVQSAVGGAIAEAEGALGSAIAGAQGAIQGGIKSAFSSVENMFAGSGSKDCVALGVPDTQKIDPKAFGGGIGLAGETPIESLEEDEIQAGIGEALAQGDLNALPSEEQRPNGGREIVGWDPAKATWDPYDRSPGKIPVLGPDGFYRVPSQIGTDLAKPSLAAGSLAVPSRGIETAVLEPQKFVVPAPPELFDGGGF